MRSVSSNTGASNFSPWAAASVLVLMCMALLGTLTACSQPDSDLRRSRPPFSDLSRPELPFLDYDKREAMGRLQDSFDRRIYDRPPSSASELQDMAITACREVGADKQFGGRLKLVVNPDLVLWQTISSWESFDEREIAVLCIDARHSTDGWMLYHGLTFRGELVIQTLKPKWADHGISLPDKD